jgi:SPP1 gp7 family putative phage head morphogenesis protein
MFGVGLHLSLLAAANRGHKQRHGNSRAIRRLRPVVPNAKAELAYKCALLSLVRHLRSLTDAALADIKLHWRVPASDGFITDGAPPDLLAPIRAAARKLGNLGTWAKRMVGIAVEANRDSVDARLGRVIEQAIGVDVSRLLNANGPLLHSMREATAANIDMIKSIPEKYFDLVTETITSGWANGLRWESLVEGIQRDGDITENRAKLIARDQTSKMNSAFNQERQQQVGIDKYEWSTSHDERVRESHAELDGETFEWAGPPMVDDEAVNPGEAINCRCVAIPIVDMEELSFATGVAEQEQEQEAA